MPTGRESMAAYRRRLRNSRGFVLVGLTAGRGLSVELAAKMCRVRVATAKRLIAGMTDPLDQSEACRLWKPGVGPDRA